MTRKRWDRLPANLKGYWAYMLSHHPGSQIPKRCPYPKGSFLERRYSEGSQSAVLEVQDLDDC